MSEPTGRAPHRCAPPRRGLAAGLTAVALALAPALPAGAAPSPASSPDLRLDVRVTNVGVSGRDAGSTLTLTGTVQNASGAPVYDVRVQPWRSTDRLSGADAVHDALIAAEPPTGEVAAQTPAYPVTTSVAALAPGASGTFSVSGTLAQLGLTDAASYWVGVNATGASAPNGDWDAHGSARTLATVAGPGRVPVATVYELAATPRRIRPDLFTDDGLPAELTGEGRLARLVRAAAAPGASWAVDPALVDEVTDMADGYRVVDGSGSRPGTGEQAARAWLDAFRALPQDAGVQTLYARPDLVGAATAGDPAVLQRGLTAARASGLDRPVVAVQERLSLEALRSLAGVGLPAVSDAVLPGPPILRAEGTPLAAAVALDEPLVSPVLKDSPATRAAAALALASASGGQVRLVNGTSPLAFDADAAATAGATWVRPVPLSEVLATSPEGTLSEEAIVERPAAGALTPGVTQRLATLARNLATYGAAAPRTRLQELAPRIASAGASESWLDDPAGRAAFLGLVDGRTRAAKAGSGVTLAATPLVTMAADNSQFPATITNGLDDTIRVRVVGQSQNSARLEVVPSAWVEIKPRDSETVLLTARASGNGVVPVALHVEAGDGTVLGKPVPVAVEATNLGAVGWVIIAVSGVVLVITTALRIRQVRRARARAAGRGA